jgi:hypothetical protein
MGIGNMKSEKEPLDEIFDDLSNREVEPPAIGQRLIYPKYA